MYIVSIVELKDEKYNINCEFKAVKQEELFNFINVALDNGHTVAIYKVL